MIRARRRSISRRGLWADRDFTIFWSGETTSLIGTSVASVALPLVAIHSLHASTFVISALTAGTWFPWLILGLPAGGWVDRLPRRQVMLTADLLSLLAFASVPVADWLGVLTIAQLIAVALIAGSAAVFFQTAWQVFVPSLIAEPDLLEANAKLTASRSAAQVVGPGLAGLIAQLLGAVIGLLGDAVSFAVSFLCLTAIRSTEPERPARQHGEALRTEVREGLSFLLHDPLLRPFLAFAAVANLFFTGMNALEVVFLVRTVGISSAELGVVFAIVSIGGVIGAVTARSAAARWGSARVALVATLFRIPFGLLLPLTSTGLGVLFWAVGLFVVDGSVVGTNVLTDSFIQTYTPRPMLGRVSAAQSTASYSMMPVGALIAGLLSSALGTRPALWLLCAGISASSLIFLVSPVRNMRDLPSTPREWPTPTQSTVPISTSVKPS